ncbi:SDR family NAD(P)-dependent oxidoreductase [Curtobacterium herbarum]|uniref:SDR family NAD(P)-dependent oxidoreductase n=1 Tax=Curtobacterium herbarum TaxID=150122 RepID=A0ABN1ZEP4_9MICO|nr:SDR family NAD(P)-dependent oxidoreductase [Curtobacterium herbarum]MBM7475519.1 NAD(P)-dependent dehydrogenase (short-subunit alcohol dehydrogenase family) [Curtobacterium herbarum]MCS6543434.1 SDR family NAD(P)-dependent oxidoreductase [Curtobacterium herbarum]
MEHTVLVTGSTDGLGRRSAESLLADGHHVVVHARNSRRAETLADLVDRGATLVTADLADIRALWRMADDLRGAGLTAVIHNAGVISGPDVLPVNVVAPYLLTALLPDVRRHVVLSSGMHRGGSTSLDRIDWGTSTGSSYSDSKLFVTAFAAVLPRRRPGVVAHAVDPGWVPTKMGGAGAPDDLEAGHHTQDWLAVTDDPDAATPGYWYHRERATPVAAARDSAFQGALLAALADLTGERL